MRCWIVATYEPLPEVDVSARLLRCGTLAQQLTDDGDEVTWWSSTFHHVRKENRFESSRTIEVRDGLRLELLHAPPYRRNVSLRRVRHNRAMARAFWTAASSIDERPDVIFAAVPSLELAESAVRHAVERGIPIVVDARDKWPDVYLNAVPPALRSAARRTLGREFDRARRIFSAATGITGISDAYLEWALGYAGRERSARDAVVPLGFPIPDALSAAEVEGRMLQLRDSLELSPSHCVVTFLGMFGLSYDLECVVAAARLLHEAGDESVRIVLAGTGEAEGRIRRLADGLPNVRFPGWLNQGDAWALLHASRAGLAPYHADATQSLPNKGFEYMAAGIPVVSSLGGELRQLLDEEGVGLTYRAGDAASLAGALRRLASDDTERRAMGARARRLYDQRYSTSAIYSGLARHLRDVASSGAAPESEAIEASVRLAREGVS